MVGQPPWQLVAPEQRERVIALSASRGSGAPPLFIEVNVAGEPTKFGVRPEQVADLVARTRGLGLPVTGLMTVAPRVAEPDQARPVFAALRHLAQDLDLPQLSMGMTDDFEAAILEGATHVRIGRAIFGERDQ